MTGTDKTYFDVVVIGGGPAGITACLELSRSSELKTLLVENESDLGGIPRSAHVFFGLRDQKRLYTGAGYARMLDRQVRKTATTLLTRSTVLDILPGDHKGPHRVRVATPRGMKIYECRYLLLATGCYESSREKRLIAGTRPAGIFTTGTLQKMVNLEGLRPGRRAVIIGTEHVSFSSAMSLKHAGVSIAGMVEEDDDYQTYALPAKLMSTWWGFPIYRQHGVNMILGHKRVEGVELQNRATGEVFRLDCDTVVVTGRFRPDAALIFDGALQEDPDTAGPVVDLQYETSVRNIFAAGNVLRGANTHDLCALEGRYAAKSIVRRSQGSDEDKEDAVFIKAEHPIRYAVPQRVDPKTARAHRASWFKPGASIQTARTLKRPVLEAYCGEEKVWSKSYGKIVANTTVPLPIECFDWDRIDPHVGLSLRVLTR